MALSLFSLTAQASTTYYTANSTVNGNPANAEAGFTLSSGVLVIELWNTGGPGDIAHISSELTGITFALTGGSGITMGAMTGSAPLGGEACTATCTPQAAPASPFGWTISGDPTFCLDAGGCGTYHPEAIVNSNVTPHGNNGGTSNPQHNPLLLSSTDDSGSGVTFTIDFTDTVAPTGIGSVDFYFGTSGGNVDGSPCSGCGGGGTTQSLTTPEPASMALTASGLVALLFVRRKIALVRR